jgi:hypothetical protein
MSMTTRRIWAYGLTADDWMQLACAGADSEVQPCCGNISRVRELIWTLLPLQGPHESWMRAAIGKELIMAVALDGDDHCLGERESFPLLHKVLDGLRSDIERHRMEIVMPEPGPRDEEPAPK